MRSLYSTTALALAAAVLLCADAEAAATAISSGTFHSCALLSDGTVRCWGDNDYGQLGDGTRKRRLTAVGVRGLTNAKTISTGSLSSCAVLAGGTVACWGYNRNGELGDGTKTDRLTPVPVTGVTDAVSVKAGGVVSCALLADRTVRCWGENAHGGLGNGTRTSSLTAVPVAGLTDVTAISIENGHGCALLAGGTVSCWGWSGSLGNTPEVFALDAPTPVPVPGVTGAVAIDAGPYNDCVVLDRGVAQCWSSFRPLAVVPRLTRVRAYSWSIDGQQTQHGCALLADGRVRCHSDNGEFGQLGNGTRTKSDRPVTVSGIRHPTMISVASFFTCALLSTGSVKCWGHNADGELGDGTRTWRLKPVSVRGLA